MFGTSLGKLTLVVCLGVGAVSEASVDFAVTSIKAPVAVLPGAPFSVPTTVCNRGTEEAGTTVDLLLSLDEVASGDDAVIAVMHTSPLAAGACRVLEVPVNVHGHEGRFHLLASADSGQLTPEDSEANNVRDAGPFGVGLMPEFIISGLSGPAAAWDWGNVAASVTVCNQGTLGQDASAFLFLSADTDISWQDTFVANMPAGFLAPGQCSTLDLQGWLGGVPQGVYHLGALVQGSGGEPEVSFDNNTRVGALIGIGDGPEFVIPSITTPASAPWGTPFMASVSVCNQGTNAGTTAFEVFLVPSLEAPPAGPPVAQGYASLAPGQCATQDVFVDTGAITEGTWFPRAVINTMGQPELIVSNNITHGAAIGIGYGSDFVVSNITVPASVQPCGSFTSSVTVCNQGTRAEDVDVSVFLVSAPEEEPAGPGFTFYLGWLAPGQCATTPDVFLTLDPLARGQQFVRATVDRGGQRFELNELNNTRDSSAVLVQY